MVANGANRQRDKKIRGSNDLGNAGWTGGLKKNSPKKKFWNQPSGNYVNVEWPDDVAGLHVFYMQRTSRVVLV